MDQTFAFRAREDFLSAVRIAARRRGVTASRLIRDVLAAEIEFRPTRRGLVMPPTRN